MAKFRVLIDIQLTGKSADDALNQVVDVIKTKPEGIENFYMRKNSTNGSIEVILSEHTHDMPDYMQ